MLCIWTNTDVLCLEVKTVLKSLLPVVIVNEVDDMENGCGFSCSVSVHSCLSPSPAQLHIQYIVKSRGWDRVCFLSSRDSGVQRRADA